MELRENTQNSKPFLQQPTCVTWIAGGLLTAVKQNVLEENLKNKVLLRSAKQLVDHRIFPSPPKLRMDIPKYPIFWREIPSLKTYTYSFAPENRPGPKKEIHLPTIHIQVLNMIVSGRVSFDFSLGSMDWLSIFKFPGTLPTCFGVHLGPENQYASPYCTPLMVVSLPVKFKVQSINFGGSKLMIGILVSFWDGLFSGATPILFFGRNTQWFGCHRWNLPAIRSKRIIGASL